MSGLVEPAAPLAAYLPDYPNDELAARVNIHHLLTHCGGTGDIFVPEYLARRKQVRTIDDYVALLGSRAPRFQPGTRYYLGEHVFAPAGMTRTGALPEEAAVPDLAVGYTRYNEEREAFDRVDVPERPNTGMLPYRGSPAGGAYSTVEDLWRFATALLGHRLLDPHHTALVTTAQGTVGWEGRCAGYGFFENLVLGRVSTFGHKGGGPGMNGDLSFWPETGHVFPVLTNTDPPAAEVVSGFICCLLPAMPE